MTVMPPTGAECRPGVRAMCPEPQIATRGGRRADVQYAKVMFSAVKDGVSQTLFIFFMTVCREARQGKQHTKENRNTAAHHARLYFCFMSVLSRRWRVSERVVFKGIEDCREIAFARVREQHHDALAGILRTFRNLSRCESSRA